MPHPSLHPEKLVVAIASEALDIDWAPDVQIRVVRAESVADAEPWMSCPSLAAWLIGDEHDSEALADFAQRADREQPNVPLVLMAKNPRELRPLGSISADLVLVPGTTAAQFAEKLDTLASASTYGDELVAVVAEATEAAFQTGFCDQFQVVDACVRTSRQPGHEFNAVLPMCGPATAGRLSVSASRELLQCVHRQILPGAPTPNERTLEDIVAEMSNQAVGMLKRYCEDRGVRFDLGVPWTYIGKQCPVHYRTRTASLLMELKTSEHPEKLLVDVVLDVFKGELSAPMRDSSVNLGEVAFL